MQTLFSRVARAITNWTPPALRKRGVQLAASAALLGAMALSSGCVYYVDAPGVVRVPDPGVIVVPVEPWYNNGYYYDRYRYGGRWRDHASPWNRPLPHGGWHRGWDHDGPRR